MSAEGAVLLHVSLEDSELVSGVEDSWRGQSVGCGAGSRTSSMGGDGVEAPLTRALMLVEMRRRSGSRGGDLMFRISPKSASPSHVGGSLEVEAVAEASPSQA